MSEEFVEVRPVYQGPDPLVAHSPGVTGQWHMLRDHLLSTSKMAADFASAFGGGSLAGFLGLVHDAGKATTEVQQALRRCAVDLSKHLGVPHKGEGAELGHLLLETGRMTSAVVAYLGVYGHHSSIPDWDNNRPAAIDLHQDMEDDPHRLDELIRVLDHNLGLSLRETAQTVTLPSFVSEAERTNDMNTIEMFVRMCHSALVDADFLDTEKHFAALNEVSHSSPVGMQKLAFEFFSTYEEKYGNVPLTLLNRVRRELFEAAKSVGRDSNGSIFRLPAQTGMGKTMAVAAFALEHARTHDKKRIIIAVPYTSITTQNAHEYRSMFSNVGQHVVLEHHSNILDSDVADDQWRRFAASGWDAEFIVTTTVQLFDSLFSNKPSSTRKLHRLADSVIVIDEVQALPREAVPSILSVLRELTDHYGTTVVLSSATQPRFWARKEWEGLADSIIDIWDPYYVPPVTRRVRYEIRREEQEWDDIADQVVAHDQALVIVNSTKDAQTLHSLICGRLLGDDAVIHLSTRMCARHRADALARIRALLEAHAQVRVISTQLIEAGVDVDFPYVYRAIAPADSIVQSAGRCNREGKLEGFGVVTVFRPHDGITPPGDYRWATAQTEAFFVDPPFGADHPWGEFGDPESMEEYYSLLDSTDPNDPRRNAKSMAAKVSAARSKLRFVETANTFRMIDSSTIPVIVTSYGSLEDREQVLYILESLETDPLHLLSLEDQRFLQAYIVALPPWSAQPGMVHELVRSGRSSLWEWKGEYNESQGIIISQPTKEASIW